MFNIKSTATINYYYCHYYAALSGSTGKQSHSPIVKALYRLVMVFTVHLVTELSDLAEQNH